MHGRDGVGLRRVRQRLLLGRSRRQRFSDVRRVPDAERCARLRDPVALPGNGECAMHIVRHRHLLCRRQRHVRPVCAHQRVQCGRRVVHRRLGVRVLILQHWLLHDCRERHRVGTVPGVHGADELHRRKSVRQQCRCVLLRLRCFLLREQRRVRTVLDARGVRRLREPERVRRRLGCNVRKLPDRLLP